MDTYYVLYLAGPVCTIPFFFSSVGFTLRTSSTPKPAYIPKNFHSLHSRSEIQKVEEVFKLGLGHSDDARPRPGETSNPSQQDVPKCSQYNRLWTYMCTKLRYRKSSHGQYVQWRTWRLLFKSTNAQWTIFIIQYHKCSPVESLEHIDVKFIICQISNCKYSVKLTA